MPRLTRKNMQQQTRERLLEAARKEIACKGISEASIRRIADTAGYTLGAFYSNFSSKEAMLLELMEEHMLRELQNFRKIANKTENDTRQEMLNKVSAWLSEIQQNRDLVALSFEFQMYANRTPSFRAEFEKNKAKKLQEFADGLKELFSRHRLEPKIDFLQMAIGFAALWSGFFIQGTVPGAQPADKVIMIFLEALLDNAIPVQNNR